MNTYVFFLKKYLSLTLNENKFDLILETENSKSLHLKKMFSLHLVNKKCLNID